MQDYSDLVIVALYGTSIKSTKNKWLILNYNRAFLKKTKQGKLWVLPCLDVHGHWQRQLVKFVIK